ncbi:phosphate ABC transporter substrate-binding protein PstS [Homoserinimonas sp. OAct 916]|uniref:phosphate ABC transporter substrate-binding protein PstS n=1 Tax=Homoserinimonas sp. OAct 916 TaxID=2211450 RepID=UPI000DBE8B19|nr:phosphate ABC transporter substrate-binding protein PstS [Homoserinimonas sp. OAct 916]
MKFTRLGSTVLIAAVTVAGLSSCAANEMAQGVSHSELSGTVDGAGASSQGSAQETWIAAFQTAHHQVTINYDPTGSGAGRKTFAAGGAAFAGSDSALSEAELRGTFASCAPDSSAIDLPVYIAPIVLIFNVQGVTELNLDAATIAAIFTAELTRWNDPAIVRLNPEQTMPDLPITAVHRSDDSGTTKNFTDYLHANAPAAWDAEPADGFPFPTGEGVQGTAGVVDTVKNGVGTIGYVDASKAGSLDVAKIKVGESFVTYSAEAAAAAVDASPLIEGREPGDIAIDLDRTSTAAGVYPIVLVSYLIACQRYSDPAQAALVREYLGYVASPEGQARAAEFAGSAPISASLREKVQKSLDSIR